MTDRLLSRLAAKDDDGFSLVEVIVALVLLGIAAVATLPVLVLGQRATSASRDRTYAKNLAQEQLETLRNMPYFISFANQPGGADVDLLDTYYPKLTPALGNGFAATSTGFVGAAVTGRPAGEPATGAYYRRFETLAAPNERFTRTTVLQFQSPNTAGTTNTPVSPLSTYDSDIAGRDTASSKLLTATVVLRWRNAAADARYVLSSQISAADATKATAGQIATGQALSGLGRAQAVTILGYANGSEMYMTAGTAQADGASGSSSSAAATGESASMGITGTADVFGAKSSIGAPNGSATSVTSSTVGPASGTDGYSCYFGCFGPGYADGQWASVDGGLPNVRASGTPSNPLTARLVGRGSTNAGNKTGKTFAISGYPEVVNSGLDLNYPYSDYGVMTMTGGANNVDAARGAATMVTTSGPSKSVTVTSRAMAFPVDVVATGFTRSAGAGGLLQVSLDNAELTCRASAGGTPTVSSTYSGRIRYWARQGNGTYAYNETLFSHDGNTLTTSGAAFPNPASVVVRQTTTGSGGNAVTTSRFLSEYVESIELDAGPDVTVDATTGIARASLTPLKVRTTPLRGSGDPTSTWSLELGALSCTAQDSR